MSVHFGKLGQLSPAVQSRSGAWTNSRTWPSPSLCHLVVVWLMTSKTAKPSSQPWAWGVGYLSLASLGPGAPGAKPSSQDTDGRTLRGIQGRCPSHWQNGHGHSVLKSLFLFLPVRPHHHPLGSPLCLSTPHVTTAGPSPSHRSRTHMDPECLLILSAEEGGGDLVHTVTALLST